MPVVILYHQAVLSPLDAIRIDSSRDAGTAVAYDRRLGNRTLTFDERHGPLVDRQTGSTWDISGLSISGRTLRPLLQNSQLWFVLRRARPEPGSLRTAGGN